MGIQTTPASYDPGVASKPLAVSVRDACRIIGVGNTKIWELIGQGRVKTVSIGRKRLVVYASLEALIAGDAA